MTPSPSPLGSEQSGLIGFIVFAAAVFLFSVFIYSQRRCHCPEPDNYIQSGSVMVNEKQISFPVFRWAPKGVNGQLMALAGIDGVFVFSNGKWQPVADAHYLLTFHRP